MCYHMEIEHLRKLYMVNRDVKKKVEIPIEKNSSYDPSPNNCMYILSLLIKILELLNSIKLIINFIKTHNTISINGHGPKR